MLPALGVEFPFLALNFDRIGQLLLYFGLFLFLELQGRDGLRFLYLQWLEYANLRVA